MDWNRVEGNWKRVDLTTINGRRDQLEGKILERYGYQKDHQCGTDVLSEAWNLYTVLGILERMKHPLRANTLELEQHLLSPMSVRDHRRAERMAEQAKQARFKRRLLTGRDYAEMPQERSAR
jgi:hypothetical protein